MWLLLAFLLQLYHFVRAIILTVSSCWEQHFRVAPQPLQESCRRIPKHLAILFVVDALISEETAQEVLTKSIVDAVSWCQTIGINQLTVYEENRMFFKPSGMLADD